MNSFSKSVGLATLILIGKAFPEERVLSKGIREFPNSLPGRKIEVRKVWDGKRQRIFIASNSELIRSADDLISAEKAERIATRKRFGALTEGLREKLLRMGNGEEIEVVVSVKFPAGISYLDKTKHPEHRLKEQSLQVASLPPIADIEAILGRHGISLKEKIGAGTGLARASKRQLQSLSSEQVVSGIDMHIPRILFQSGTPSLSSLAASAYNHDASPVPITGGSGINAATFEMGMPDDFLNCMGIPQALKYRFSINTWSPTHGRAVLRCLQYAAPGANLWHRAGMYFYSEEINYIIDNGLQTVSRSTSSVDYPTMEEPRNVDDMAYRWPYPVFNSPTGNNGFELVSVWNNYNGINVGNVKHVNQTTWSLGEGGGCTQTKNPSPLYGGPCLDGGTYPSCAGDREMPHLVAPGFSPTGEALTDPCGIYFEDNLNGCGTSWSTPTVNGMSANVLAADGRMLMWPEKVRVALLATAENVDAGEWSRWTDGRDGAGVVNGSSAVEFARSHSAVYPGNSPVENGIGTGSLYVEDFYGEMVFNILVPNSKPAGKHLRIVLTWDSNPVPDFPVNDLSDLDLSIQHNNGWSHSDSWNDNVEIIDIAASDLTAGGTYAAKVHKAIHRIPTGARTDFFYYAIGWTWVDDHAP